MKRRLRAAAIAIFALLLVAASRPAPEAERIRRLLPGLWQADSVQDAMSVRATSRYGRDGFVVYAGRITGPGVDLSYRVRSRWTVEGTSLATEILESDQPQLLPVGSRKRDTVLSIDGARFRYRDERGDEYEEVRLPTK